MELNDIEKYIGDGAKARSGINPKQVLDVGKEMGRRMLEGKKLILFGNGGSAADAQHIAAEFVCKFKKERREMGLQRYGKFEDSDNRSIGICGFKCC